MKVMDGQDGEELRAEIGQVHQLGTGDFSCIVGKDGVSCCIGMERYRRIYGNRYGIFLGTGGQNSPKLSDHVSIFYNQSGRPVFWTFLKDLELARVEASQYMPA